MAKNSIELGSGQYYLYVFPLCIIDIYYLSYAIVEYSAGPEWMGVQERLDTNSVIQMAQHPGEGVKTLVNIHLL